MRVLPFAALLTVTLAQAACSKTGAYGDANSIIVGVTNELWEGVEDRMKEALERRVYTVADEKTFTVTQIDPREPDWINLQKFKQVLLIGTENDPWIETALGEAERGLAIAPPQIVQVYDVWARAQLVTILLVNDGDRAGQIERLLPELAKQYDAQFRDYVVDRMFLSGQDSALADTLRAQAGFELTLPSVYEWSVADSTYVFRNDNPDPSELIRQISVSWRSPIPPPPLDPSVLLEWRAELAAAYYEDEQVVTFDQVRGSEGTFSDLPAYQITATWENPPGGWPAGGPLILRALLCREQNRLYLLDGWLYAPGKEKYEYMIQLETILNSFKCGM